MSRLDVEKAVRRRWCSSCDNEIEVGEQHIRFYDRGHPRMNVCEYCLDGLLSEIRMNKVV